MVEDELTRRMEMLEETVETLKKLPEQVASLQHDVKHLQHDVRGLDGRVTGVESQIVQLRDEMHVEFSAIRSEMRDGDEETRRLMRVLHEDVIARIALLGEGRA